jgi:hypothetical protein
MVEIKKPGLYKVHNDCIRIIRPNESITKEFTIREIDVDKVKEECEKAKRRLETR